MSPRTYEEEPAVGDYRRSVSGYDSASAADDHELTLGTPTILGLFFALALVCACFFGLGYAMGHRTAPATPQVFDNSVATTTGAAKPAAGSAAMPGPQPAIDTANAATDAAASGAPTATVPLNPPATAVPTAPAFTPAAARSAPAATASLPSSSAALPPGNFVVQVAAVSSQDVANILLSTLQKKGYAVGVRHEPQDQLLHVQIGPFPERKDAEAMRQRVIADGFNAIVK
jgi:DedD protein